MSDFPVEDKSTTIQLDVPGEWPFSQYNAILDKILERKPKTPWALLDFPTHPNVGDSAIWLGTLAILKARFHIPPKYVTRNMDFPKELGYLMPDGPIFFNGGGNFGDLWPGYWENRVAILRQFTHRKIVQLPQSIYFSDLKGKALIETQRAISEHRDYTLLVRDRASMNFAQKYFDCPVYLCPDMAFGLRHLSSRATPTTPVFALMRDDLERRDHGAAANSLHEHTRVTDWIEKKRAPFSDRFIPHLIKRIPKLNRHLMASLETTYRRQAERHLKRGIELLGQGDFIITDRLHGHILSTLMKKKHIVLDNSYGKVFNYIDTWPDDGFTCKVESIEAAMRMLPEFN